MKSLKLFKDVVTAKNAILAGDLNSNSRVSGQETTHPKFVERAHDLGIDSVYHQKSDEEHGFETVPTYRHGPGDNKMFHIDYCFVSRRLMSSANVSVLRGDQWASLSDHYPLVLDIPDTAFAPRA